MAFDCFSPLSPKRNPGISDQARVYRDRFVRALTAEGFHNYSREWWHFEYSVGPLPATPYDFPVQ